jgi:hypothetical protein
LIIRHDSHTTYFWEADKPQHNPGAYAPPDKSGTISRRETNLKQFKTNARICVKVKSVSKHSTFRKLTLEEALALELPPELLEDFPSPFATEGPQVASVPKAAAVTSASPSTPTTTTATAVDPLVGIWHWQGGLWGYADSCYLAVGMNDQGALVGKSWETHLQLHQLSLAAEEIIGFNITGVRDIAIGQVNDDSYTWKTEKTLPSAGDYWTKGGLTGKLYLNMKDQNVESLHVNNRICRKMRSESKNSRFKKLPLEEALALELPPELLEDFPSPFATEGTQVVSVPKATTSASAVPSTPTTTTATTATGVDPLVGIWQQTDVVYENCQLVVGQDSSGQLMGVSFTTIGRGKLVSQSGPRYPKGAVDWSPSDSSKGFVARKLTIEQGPGDTYTWTSEISFKGNLWEAPTAKSGKIYLSIDQNGNPRVSTKKLCMVERAAAGGGSFSKLARDEAIAMELPSIAHEDFPSPFATEGKQVVSVPKASASATAAPSTPTTTTATTATGVDPLVGIWTRASGFYGDCHFIVGQRDDDTLTAVSFQGFLRRHVIGNDSLVEWGLTDAGVGILARAISIKRTPKGAYSWESSDNFKGRDFLEWWMGSPSKKGRFSMSNDKDGNLRVSSNKWLCVEERAAPVTGTYRKLSLDEAIAMKLPSIAKKDFPSPFQDGTQWSGDAATEVVSVPNSSASASTSPSTPTTTTATGVDPLVGIWLRYEPDLFGNACRLIVGQDDSGNLVGQVWEETPKVRQEFDDQNLETIDGHKVAVTKITFQRDSSLHYRWHLEESVFKPTNVFRGASKEGMISILDRKKGEYLFSTNALMCRQKRATPPMSTFRKLTEDEALAMDLHPAIFEDFPSPFQDGTQWSGDAVATKAIETTENQDTASGTDDPDRR